MSRIPTPASIDQAPEASRPFLEGVKKQIGSVPNLFRIVANSPAALEGFLGLSGALSKGALHAATRERIALAVAEINGCNYCLAAHSYIGKNVANLDDVEIAANRAGKSNDIKADIAVRFAAKIARERGQVSVEDVNTVNAAGYSDAEIVEIIAHVALHTFTNYINEALGTEIDFPVVDTQPLRPARDPGTMLRAAPMPPIRETEMRHRYASINDLPINEADRLFRRPLGRRPDDHPGLSELGL